MTLAQVLAVSSRAIDIMSLGFGWAKRMLADEVSLIVLGSECHGHAGRDVLGGQML